MTEAVVRSLQAARAQPARAAVTLQQLDFCGRVASDNLRDLAWVTWFLRPGFFRSQGEAFWELTLRYDDPVFAQLKQFGEQSPGGEIYPCLQHSHPHGFSQSWRIGELRLLYDVEFGCFCAAWPEEGKILVIAETSNPRAASTVMRGVRELASLEHIHREGMILHAAAMEIGGKATLAIAPKRGGKTTFLIRSLLEGANLIANDRVVLRPDRKEIIASGLSTVTPLREGTIDLFPAFKQALETQQPHFRRRPAAGMPGRWNISLPQLCSLTGAGATRQAPVGKLLFLVEGSGSPIKLPEDEAGLLFAQQIFDFSDTERHFFAGLKPLPEREFQDSLARLFRHLCDRAEFLQYPREGNG
jgi:hypothetical protein